MFLLLLFFIALSAFALGVSTAFAWEKCHQDQEEDAEDEEKYARLLLSNSIRLSDIPASIRLAFPCGCTIHAYAFRADRAMGKEQFQEDLTFLENEIRSLKDDDPLKNALSQILEDYTAELADMR